MATTQTQTLKQNLLLAPKAALTTQPPPPQQRTRPYKDFLTPALHRRFTHAALPAFIACYITSIFLSRTSILWAWNPLSLTTLRALLLFIPCLAVFIVRVANMHCGVLYTSSPAQTVMQMVSGWSGLHALGWYAFSAWFFGEVYIWSSAESAGLSMVDVGHSYERARLNENPIFLRAVIFCMAIAQAGVHLGRGEDRIAIPEKDEDPALAVEQQMPTAWRKFLSIPELQKRLPIIGGRVLRLAIPGFAFTLPIYFIFLRSWLWSSTYTLARIFFHDLPAASRPTGLSHIPTLLWQCLSSSAMLIMLWEISSAAFTDSVAQPPLTRAGQPLTSDERSKDPNASLINGLKSKKETVKSFALWELSMICTYFEARRKSIYTEVDRAGGSTWSQISQMCLDEISAIQGRINATQAPSAQQQQTSPQQKQQQPQQQSLGMPRIADRSVQNGDVWAGRSRPDFAQSVGNAAKSTGQSPNAHNPVQPYARRALEWSRDKVLSKEEQQRLNPANLKSEAGGMVTNLLRTPVGEPFRQTFARRVKAVVLGSPYGRKINIIHASRALSTLCSRSLKEDDYGQVAKSISLVLRTYVSTIRAIEGFVQGLRPSWTDVYFSERGGRQVEEVQEVVDVLKQGLEEVVLAFGEYADAVGVTRKELREARELVANGKGQEMQKA